MSIAMMTLGLGQVASAKKKPGKTPKKAPAESAAAKAGKKASSTVRPWAQGVTQAEQDAATQLFEQGNQEFANKAYDTARKLYERALTHWKHPAAQFNLAECLILLDSPVEAYRHLKESMRFGVEPLGPAMLQRAVVRKQLLEGQLATLRIKNPVAGAKVTLNGELLFSGKDQATRLVRPGHFQIVATKSGYLTQTVAITLLPSKTKEVTISLRRPSSEDVEFARRWSTWKPWALVGGAVAMGAAGGYLYTHSVAKMDAYDREIALQCPNGCEPASLPGSTRNLKDQSELFNAISFVTMGTAGVMLATGVVLVYMNQLHPQTESKLSVAASPTRDGGLSASLSYDF